MTRTVYRPSASAIERSLACELSAVLVRPPEAPRAHNGPASRGDRIHAALERYKLGARLEDIEHVLLGSDIGNLKEVCEKMPIIHPIDDYPMVEVEMWLNPMTGESKLGTAETPVEEGFWRGRADLIGWFDHPIHGRVPACVDYKSGNPGYQIYGDAAQLAYFGVNLHIQLGAPYVWTAAYLTQDPDRPRGHLWSPDELTEEFRRLRNHELRLQELESSDEMPLPVTGKQCTFCPVKSVCPAWQKASEDAKP